MDADFCSESLESLEMKVDGSRTDCASSGKGNPGDSLSSEKGSHNQEGRSHFVYQFIGRFCGADILCFDMKLSRFSLFDL